MTPKAAFEYVQSRRSRVKLHQAQLEAVKEYSKRKQECRSPKSLFPSARDEVLITAADLVSYNNESAEQNVSITDMKQSGFMILKHDQSNSFGGDGVVIEEADLEGYDTHVNAHGKMSCSNGDVQNVSRMRSLCCLFVPFKLSSAKQTDG